MKYSLENINTLIIRLLELVHRDFTLGRLSFRKTKVLTDNLNSVLFSKSLPFDSLHPNKEVFCVVYGRCKIQRCDSPSDIFVTFDNKTYRYDITKPKDDLSLCRLFDIP